MACDVETTLRQTRIRLVGSKSGNESNDEMPESLDERFQLLEELLIEIREEAGMIESAVGSPNSKDDIASI